MASSSEDRVSSKSKTSSSFDAFSKVDDIVSRPVFGSDGAASWQSFRNENKKKDSHLSSAPKVPLKRADKLGTGFSTWDDERDYEKKVRKDAGHASTGSGYVVFNKKENGSNKEKAERIRKAQIEDRIRPDDIEYFIPSKIFQGWKFDYIFTTKNDVNNTGYYWDGMDSVKKQNNDEAICEEEPKLKDKVMNNNNKRKVKKSSNRKEKSKKKKRNNNDNDNSKIPVIVHNPNNPREQMQAMLQRRNQQLTGVVTDFSLPVGWEAAKDTFTGNVYYFHRATGDRSWEKPKIPEDASNDHEGGEMNINKSLPEGWKSATDKSSGNSYYHNTNGDVTWTKPQ